MYIFHMDELSLDEWCEVCNFQPPIEYQKINTEKSIIIILRDDLVKLSKYLNGEKEIPSLKESEDILGDINSCDVTDYNWEYGHGWNCTIDDINGLNMTNGYIGSRQQFKLPKFETIKDPNGTYYADSYPLRKGYPSFMMKKWES